MTTKDYLLNAGTAGAQATTTDTGASLLSKPNGGSISWAASAAGSAGPVGLLLTNAANAQGASGNQALARFAAPTSTSKRLKESIVFRTPAAVDPNGFSVVIATMRYASGAVLNLFMGTDRSLYLRDATTSGINVGGAGVLLAPGTSVALNTQYTLKWRALAGATATSADGQVTATLFPFPDTGTRVAGSNIVTSTTAVLRSDPIVATDVGVVSANNGAMTVGITELRMDDAASETDVPSYVAGQNAAPTVTVGASQTVAVGGTANLSSTATDTDGTIASRQWTFDTLPVGVTAPNFTAPTAAATSFTPTVAGLYVARMTVTDNAGATGFATQKVFVPSTTARVVSFTSSSGAWVAVGGSTLSGVLNDDSTTSYVESGEPTASEQRLRMRLAPLQTMTSFQLTLDDRLSAAPAAGTTAKLRLMEGTIMRKEWIVTPSTTAAIPPLTMTAAECATVTSWNELDVEFAWQLVA
jgi:hypothetical protein